MDKSSQNNLYAGLLIYRSQRNVEYLLLNDSFTNKKHWFCPKGQVIGQEDEVKCALRETFEATGLSPKDLRVEEGFKIELKYLSGTRPKKVVYRLAQILDNHARLLPNADGVHFQWCNQHVATEKVIFKSMEDVFKYAQQFIENKLKTRQQNRRNRDNNGDLTDHRQRHHHNNHYRQHGSSTATRNTSSLSSPSSPQINGLVTHHQNNINNHNHPRQQQHSLSNQQQDQQQRRQNQQNENSAAANPLYKTRLCERFEKEGTCSYGSKCTFAHGIVELRERIAEEENRNGSSNDQINGNHNNSYGSNNGAVTATAAGSVASVAAVNNSSSTTTNNKSTSSNAEANPLYKTKLCERFMKDNFCQYGPKCHFAHGTQELKERPVFNNNNENGNGRQSEDDQYSSSQQPYQEKQQHQEVDHHHHHHHHHQMQSQTQQPQRVASPPMEHHYQQQPQQLQQRYFRQQQQQQHGEERSAADGSWRARTHINNSTTINNNINSNANSHKNNNNNNYHNMDENLINNPEHPDLSKRDIVEDIPKPIAVKQNGRSNSINNNITTTTATTTSSNNINKNNSINNNSVEKQHQRNSNTPLQEVMNGRISPTNKSWMKVVHLSKEEQAKLEMSPPAKTPSPTPAKAAQEESIIGDLKKYFAEHTASQATSNGKLSDDVKEVTKLEMRNDLSKRQLLFILLASLLEDSPSGVGATLKARITLFQTFVKSMTDQRTLLKAWEKFVTQRSPGLLSKTVVAFSTWYDCDLVDEEAFFGWYAVLQDGSELKIKSSKFIEWLSTADEDDEE